MNRFNWNVGNRHPVRLTHDVVRLVRVPLALAMVCLGGSFLIGCGKQTAEHAPAAAAAKKTAQYHCPMHPTYTSDKRGDCPICNMALVPIQTELPAATDEHAGHGETTASSVPGRMTIQISPDRRQQIGLTTAPVEKRPLAQTITIPAVVEHDETRLATIAPRVGGWVRELYVNYIGQPVEKGQPLLKVYSPELLATQNEYLLARQQLERLQHSADAEAREGAKRLLEAARRRLALWEIGEEEIRALEARGTASDEMLLRAPFSGHVVTKNAVEGKAFAAGETLYEIADLTHLWLRAFVPESELPFVRVGQEARVVFPYLQNKEYESAVAFLYPHIEPQTRRAELRLELDNPEHLLRPGMWARAEIEVDAAEVLAVPASAVMDTGERFLAFVDKDAGKLEPRELKIGLKTDEYWEVREGLSEGERVVTRALFLVDSESQLRAAIAGMGAAGEHKH